MSTADKNNYLNHAIEGKALLHELIQFGYPLKVGQLNNYQLKLAVNGFDCVSGADVFHEKYGISRWLSSALGRQNAG